MGVSEEEETRALLEESPAHQPLERRPSINQVRPVGQAEVPRPRAGWEVPHPFSTPPREVAHPFSTPPREVSHPFSTPPREVPHHFSGQPPNWEGRGRSQLTVGAAEKTFFAMNGALAAAVKRGKGEEEEEEEDESDTNDTNTKVPDESIEVVKEILSEIELETDIKMSASGYTTCPEEESQGETLSISEVGGCMSEGEGVSMTEGGSAPPNHIMDLVDVSICPASSTLSTAGVATECSECQCEGQDTPRVQGSTSLVVDVHMEQEVRCSKHTIDRFPRCYSESFKGGRGGRGEACPRQELQNLDKIETVCEDRLRHFSESQALKRGRASTLTDELRQFKRSFMAGRSQDIKEPITGEDDIPGRSATSSSSNVKFDIFDEAGSGSESEFCEVPSADDTPSHPLVPHHQVPHPLVVSLRSSCPPPTMSTSSSTTSMPICRICQLPSIEPNNHLISPCRCLGSIRYVHNPCLLKWLEVSSKKNGGPPSCELCQYQYLRHKKFVISHCLFPSCSAKDKFLHSVFIVAIAIMITCAAVTILCFKQDRGNRPKVVGPNTELSGSELMTLSCGVFFFLAFFIAMYVEVKAKNTIYQLICKFFYMNHEWSIEEYDRRRDPAKQMDSA